MLFRSDLRSLFGGGSFSRFSFRNGLVLFGILCFVSGELQGNASGQTLEFDGGETVFSQNSQYYFAEAGDFLNIGGLEEKKSSSDHPEVGTASTDLPTLHLFVVASYFAYETPGTSTMIENSYNGITPALGVRIPFQNGFWEGDLGIALAEAYQTSTPIISLIGLYAQTEYYRTFGPGALDIFANYTGYIQYIYVQSRYLTPVWEAKKKSVSLYLGPELIGQGNNSYNAGQGGVALGVSFPAIHSYLTFDGGLLRSSVSSGWGGYQGFSWYWSF
ncbi:hypothetical protein [Leptospirillum ferrooxidans]|uniref:Uncharacterized protein n=1 Tax=Leptospirillum ferrooxidans (strain C2-3) TaxID=1162668 RepID=I0IP77_LEPFC|nr:hypothetical protein [Leptospirillum ferrooxidans]BAM07076.1 hypothetical protein LFE_1393 [Leptospirillum ferrooxidans C2-3]